MALFFFFLLDKFFYSCNFQYFCHSFLWLSLFSWWVHNSSTKSSIAFSAECPISKKLIWAFQRAELWHSHIHVKTVSIRMLSIWNGSISWMVRQCDLNDTQNTVKSKGEKSNLKWTQDHDLTFHHFILLNGFIMVSQ